MIDRVEWAKGFLRFAGWPVTKHNLWALVAWEAAEGGPQHVQARFNPLNTTKRKSGSTLFNAVGVQNYPTLEQGYDATLSTLLEGRGKDLGYEGIIDGLQHDRWARTTLRALRTSEWGTGALALAILRDVKRYWEQYAKQPIGQ